MKTIYVTLAVAVKVKGFFAPKEVGVNKPLLLHLFEADNHVFHAEESAVLTDSPVIYVLLFLSPVELTVET